jgi:hypothetical protein
MPILVMALPVSRPPDMKGGGLKPRYGNDGQIRQVARRVEEERWLNPCHK